ncbi:MAG TPA: tRNA (adenosine(37)-N6)-threonylcarbamoyltransferase complex ATPase subunit type 1 TsaE [Phnomibacter sp.]|nr:tRNA (adenosine(37)-N6)-threonylcarbamoyltransferase complex ATPase subunit type 1 TsaE [Phnomibacter sp.]
MMGDTHFWIKEHKGNNVALERRDGGPPAGQMKFNRLFCSQMRWEFSLKDIDDVAKMVLGTLAKGSQRVIALHGPMGAGKTTFSAAFLRALGGKDQAGSPTFSIINQYIDEKGDPVYHMDWYRLRDEEEAMQAGVEDPLYSGHWCLVEWPEKAAALLPENSIHLYLSLLDDGSRKIADENVTY